MKRKKRKEHKAFSFKIIILSPYVAVVGGSGPLAIKGGTFFLL